MCRQAFNVAVWNRKRCSVKTVSCALKAVELTSGDLPLVLNSGLRAKQFALTGRQKSAEGVLGTQVLKARTVPRKGLMGAASKQRDS